MPDRPTHARASLSHFHCRCIPPAQAATFSHPPPPPVPGPLRLLRPPPPLPALTCPMPGRPRCHRPPPIRTLAFSAFSERPVPTPLPMLSPDRHRLPPSISVGRCSWMPFAYRCLHAPCSPAPVARARPPLQTTNRQNRTRLSTPFYTHEVFQGGCVE
jgi:hypothetical protein